jgi:hypothetical protein
MIKNFSFLYGTIVLSVTIVLIFLSSKVPAQVTKMEYEKGLNGFARINGQQIKIHFTRPMNQKTVEKAFTITPQVNGNFSWSGETVFFSAKEPLTANTEYSITFNQTGKTTPEDVYKKALAGFHQNFKTPPAILAYIGNDDQLYISELDQEPIKITHSKTVTQFTAAGYSGKIVYIDKSLSSPYSKVFVYDINTGLTIELFKDMEADFSDPSLSMDGTRLYLLSVSPGKEVYTTQKDVYEYNFLKKTKKNFPKIIKDHPQLVSIWLLPDGNTFLFNDYEANFYLRPIAENKSTLIGKVNDFFGGYTFMGDKLLFGDTDAKDNWRPFLKLYDGKSFNIVREKDSAIFYEISLDGKYVVYSFLPDNEEEDVTDQRLGIKVVSVENNNVILSHIEDDISLERGKISPDNSILAVEMYKRTGHFLDIFGVSPQKEYSQLKLIDLKSGKFLNQTLDGKNAMWIY